LLDRTGDAARAQHGRIALIGILPTLSAAHLDLGMVTDAARYRALDRGLRRLHKGPFRIRIAGAEPLELTSEHTTAEGANTSFQLHLRVAPGRVHPELQRGSAGDRPVLAVAGQDERWTYAVPFERAEYGFYRAAQHGLAAELSWPTGRRDGVRTLPAGDLVPGLLPAARQGLLDAGVAAAEADRLLGVIGARVASGQTGAAWQRAALAAAESDRGRDQALAVMLDWYLSHAATGQPVHTWPV
ncbi:MAG: hypothetical protein ACRDPF_36355, partial [Streptosporangiaceae bacterium]